MKNIYLVRIEWTDNGYVNSEVILTQQKTMQLATKWVLQKFERDRPSTKDFRITWVEDISRDLFDKYGVTIYMHGPFGLHDPFCSSNRGKT